MPRPELFPEIALTLKRRIAGENLAPGTLFLRREDVMREFGVTIKTAQKAFAVLNAEGFTDSVRGRGTFVAEQPPHRCHYGLVLEGSAREPERFPRFMAAVEREAEAMALTDSVRFSVYRQIGFEMNWDEFARLEADLKAHRLAGIVLVHSYTRLAYHGRFPWEESRTPCVSIGDIADDSHSPQALTPDMRSFVELALDRLAGLGRRKVAFVDIQEAYPKPLDEQQTRAIQARGMTSPLHWRQSVQVSGMRACLHLLMHPKHGERPDGLVIMDDHAAEAATAALAELGVRVPEDLAVVSLANERCLPRAAVPVTWLGFDTRELLTRSLELLQAQRAGKKAPMQSWLKAREVGAGVRKREGVRG